MTARFGPAVKTFLLCLLIASAGVGYVNQKNQIQLLSYKMGKLEREYERQRLHHQILHRKLTALNSPNELEAQVHRMNLDLSPTAPDRIVHLSGPPRDLVRKEEALFAGQPVAQTVRR